MGGCSMGGAGTPDGPRGAAGAGVVAVDPAEVEAVVRRLAGQADGARALAEELRRPPADPGAPGGDASRGVRAAADAAAADMDAWAALLDACARGTAGAARAVADADALTARTLAHGEER